MTDGTQRQTENGGGSANTGPPGQIAGKATGSVERPGLPMGPALATIALIAGAIATGETNRLVTGALTGAGESRAVSDVVGLAALRGREAWTAWEQLLPSMRQSVAVWIYFYACFDIALYLGYWVLLRTLLARSGSTSSLPRRALWALLALEIVETVLLLLGGGLLFQDGVPRPYRWTLAGVATLKWLTGAVLLLALLADDQLRKTVGGGFARVLRAVWQQRLSLVVVAVAGVLTLVPLPNIWDQLPDVERSWFDGDLDDVLHPLWGTIAVAVVSAYLFVVGRLFSQRVWTTRVGIPAGKPQPPQEKPQWWWWMVPPVLTLVTAAILSALPVDDLVDGQNVAWVVALPLVILALSWLVVRYYRLHARLRLRFLKQAPGDGKPGWWRRWWRQWLGQPRALWQEPPEPEDRDRALDVWLAGDVLAVSVVAMAGLGLVRSLTAPVLLGPFDTAMVTWIVRLLMLLAGAVLAGVTFPLAAKVLDRLDRELPESWVKRLLRPNVDWRPRSRVIAGRDIEGKDIGKVIALVLWVIAVAALVVLMVYPLQISQWFGVVAVTLLGLGLWAAVLGLLMALLQDQRPLPIFQVLRLRSTPVLTLLLVLPLVASQAGGDPDVHALSDPPGGAPAAVPQRPTLSKAFTDWLDRSQACDRQVDTTDGRTVRVRPMVLVAASGGGIRSAVWTARVMDRLHTSGDCASQAVFLSSGLSGGSVGLAASRGQDPIGDAKELAKPDALAAGIVGTLVGDIIAGSSGLRIPSLALLDEEGKEPAGRERWDWRDRAGLMEAAWEAKVASLTARYDERLSGPAGALVLNSTAAGRGCRILVSQIRLPPGPEAAGLAGSSGETGSPETATCQGRTNQPPASLDLQDIYGNCTPDMSWATAAMLSARFATLTPGGRVPPVTRRLPSGTGGAHDQISCAGRPKLQLIDGGYAEGSGIGTLADIAPALLEVVRDHNVTPPDAKPLVVPVLLYLEDETRSDIVRQPQGLSADFFVPLAGRSAKFVQTSSGTWLQRMAASIADPCPTVDRINRQRCLDADAAVQGGLAGGIVIAAPLTKPSVEAPLGWTLSEDSHNRLEEDAEAQATECPPARPGGYPCLRQLLDVLEPDRA